MFYKKKGEIFEAFVEALENHDRANDNLDHQRNEIVFRL